MPELPEVETVANGVNARVRGERIAGAWFSRKPEPMKTAPAVMERVLTGARILRVHRVGKTVVFDLERDNDQSAQWLVHLGMTGQLLVAHADLPRPEHTHAVLTLAGGRELRFIDPRRFGRLSIFGQEGPDVGRGGKKQATGKRQQATANQDARPEILSLPASVQKTRGAGTRGVDPSVEAWGFSPTKKPAEKTGFSRGIFTGSGAEPLTITANEFAALFRARATPIKSALLNQKLLHGVGNIYADEALFRAGVRPMRRAARITRAEMERLRVVLVEVLRQAIKLGGSSVSDYVDADGAKGFFQLEHRVYQRTGEPCLVCGTSVRKRVIGGRSSHFCPQCQR